MVADRLAQTAITQLAKRGFVMRRNPAVRRQAMLRSHGVDVVFDVGAAKGAYGQELRAFGYDGLVVSFEPLAEAYGRLVRTRGDDPRWVTIRCALGDRAEQTTINVASNSDSSSLLPFAERHLRAAPQVGYVGTEVVDVERLDAVAPEHLKPGSRAFLKLDTQGFERQVLEGAGETLRQCVGLQLELSFVPLYDGGMLVDEAVAMAYAQGFHLVGLDPGFADPNGQVLQADGVFFRDQAD
jgi:FkbM family methyltransferase